VEVHPRLSIRSNVSIEKYKIKNCPIFYLEYMPGHTVPPTGCPPGGVLISGKSDTANPIGSLIDRPNYAMITLFEKMMKTDAGVRIG